MSWSSAQYSKFEDERTRPARDLIARIPERAVVTAADIGCGPGNSTELLRDRFPDAVITAIDNSADMIAAARKRLPNITFGIDDIATWRDAGPFDVILANAALQWIPDHEFLLPRLIEKLARGGSLAVQMPDNPDEPSHRIMREIAAAGPWAAKLSGAPGARAIRREPDWYFRTLQNCDTTVDIWRTVYYHPLAGGAGAVTEWFKGTGLRPFLDPLDETERAAFLHRYQSAIEQAYPAMADGTVLLPFPRLFFVATSRLLY